jgi:hypothetical protein
MSSNNKKILYGTLIAVILVASIVTVVVMTQNKDDDTDSNDNNVESRSKFTTRAVKKPIAPLVDRQHFQATPGVSKMFTGGRLIPLMTKERFQATPGVSKISKMFTAGRLIPLMTKERFQATPDVSKMFTAGRLQTVEPYGPRARPKGLTRESFVPIRFPSVPHPPKEPFFYPPQRQIDNLTIEGFAPPKERFTIAECPCSSEHEGECPSGCNCSKCNAKESYKHSKKHSKKDDPYVFVDQHLGDAIGGIGSAIKNDLRGSGAADSIRPPITILSAHDGHQNKDSWFVPAQFGRAPAPHAAKWIM